MGEIHRDCTPRHEESGSGFEELLDPNYFGDQGGISIWSKNWN